MRNYKKHTPLKAAPFSQELYFVNIHLHISVFQNSENKSNKNSYEEPINRFHFGFSNIYK